MLFQKDILHLFDLLNKELESTAIQGEIYLVGGAVMCLAFKSRPSTRDVDAYFLPSSELRQAAVRIAIREGIPENWLNDGVRGFLSPQGRFDAYLDLSHLKVFTARADYLLAMKCLAMRIGEEFHDVEDVRYLLRNLDLHTYDDALKIITRYYPLEQFPQKTLYALEEMFGTSA